MPPEEGFEDLNVNYDVSRATAILRAAYAQMAAADATGARIARPSAMGDLELAGVKTGAVHVLKRRRRKAA